ncbi:MAG: DUF1566 domain-containing protein [Bacteroidetes bacterium]|nr:MAG: DUF1566 domain-containing protein [Bacteroidota bacterium]
MYNAFISYSHAADDKFASALQNALQKFAKPWYKKRNLEIFRDESSLSASPHLWNNIVNAMNGAEYFVLLASSKSEQSKWVSRELEYWLQHKSIDKLLIVLTEGEIKWDDENKCFLKPDNNSLPAILDDKFTDEPFYVDLRKSKTEKDISLDNPIFKKEILKLAAKLHGRSPNDMASEEVTIHRKTILIRNGAIGLLLVLLILSIVAGVIANQNRKQAEKNKKEAEEQTKIAKKNLTDFLELKKTSIGSKYQGGIVFQWTDSAGKKGVIAAEKDLPGTYNWKDAYAACQQLTLNGYSDWRLPTREEIGVLYANRIFVGGFERGFYWSETSYEGHSDEAFFQSFVHGDRLSRTKTRQYLVRAVRSF